MAEHAFFPQQGVQQIARPFGSAADFGAPDTDDAPSTIGVVPMGQQVGTKRLHDDDDIKMEDGVQLRKRRKKKAKSANLQDKNALMLVNELRPELDFILSSQEGPPHAPTFVVTVEVNGQTFDGSGASKQRAKHNAAEKILSSLHIPLSNPTDSIPVDSPIVEEENTEVATSVAKPPVMLLNELHDGKIDYQFETDPSQQEPFICTVEIQGKEFTGTGLSKKKAKMVVASKALEEIHGITNLVAFPMMPTSQLTQQPLVPPPADAELPRKMADTIAEITLNKFKELSSGQIRRKVLAGIVMTRRNESGDLTYEIISIGTGTKFIGGEYISEKGYAVNDCHGEIIARRGLRRYLYSQLEAFSKDGISSSILEKKESGLFGLKKDIEFHLYVSTSPCGDARVFSPHERQPGEVDDHPARKKRGLLRVKLENGEGNRIKFYFNCFVCCCFCR